MSEYIFILNNGAICWKNFKQKNIANSNCKAECIVASDACKKIMWLYRFTDKLGVALSDDGPTVLYSIGAIAHAKESKSH